jgi:DNA polymerase I
VDLGMESLKQEKIEKIIKTKVNEFLTYLNSTLPESMELEYEGFYRRGFFVSKKRYAVIEDGKIIAKGLELVRRDWAPIVKTAQKDVLMAILKNGDVNEAIEIIKKVLKKIKSGNLNMTELVIHTQITKRLSEYKQIGPHVVVARKLEAENRLKPRKGTIIQYVIVKGRGSISEKAIPYEDYLDGSYDPDYYINNQVLPAISRIMESFGYNKENLLELIENKKQQTLDAFFN